MVKLRTIQEVIDDTPFTGANHRRVAVEELQKYIDAYGDLLDKFTQLQTMYERIDELVWDAHDKNIVYQDTETSLSNLLEELQDFRNSGVDEDEAN